MSKPACCLQAEMQGDNWLIQQHRVWHLQGAQRSSEATRDAIAAARREAEAEMQSKIDAAVAREREDVRGALFDLAAKIRARSGARGEGCRCDGDLDEHEPGCKFTVRSGGKGSEMKRVEGEIFAYPGGRRWQLPLSVASKLVYGVMWFYVCALLWKFFIDPAH